MSVDSVKAVVEAKYGKEISDKLLASYIEIENNFSLQKWKPSELDAGHFVETARRIIEFEQTNQYTSFNQILPYFDDVVLKQYEQSSGDESFRMLIPRVLKSVYNIRNKRGVAHIKDISPNEMDATLILYSIKWVLAEIVRLASKMSFEETQKLIDNVIEREIPILWKEPDFKRIVVPTLSIKNQVLVLLYDESPQPAEKLRLTIEYPYIQKFKVILALHKERFIEVRNATCSISPTGRLAAEEIIKNTRII